MELKDKLIRYRLMDRHRELVRGSDFDMQVAKRILHLLNRGEIRLGLSDVDWQVEMEIEKVGVHINYRGRGYTAYARIRRPEKSTCGHWIHDINNLYGCSECRGRETMSPKKKKSYCPHCGIIMT